jgi:hypothetical protein
MQKRVTFVVDVSFNPSYFEVAPLVAAIERATNERGWKLLPPVSIMNTEQLNGCMGCEFNLSPLERGNAHVGQFVCNHPRNIQPHVRNFQRQRLLVPHYFPTPPAWCKKETDNGR